jgi:hypothetical protein
MRKLISFVVVVFIGVGGVEALAAKSGGGGKSSGGEKKHPEARFFITNTTFSKKQDALNAETGAANVEDLKSITGGALEVSRSFASWIKGGFRIGGKWTKLIEQPDTVANPAHLSVQQGYVGGVLRIPLLQTKVFIVEGFGEGGVTSTTINIKSSSGNGTYLTDNTFYSRAGGTIAIGFDHAFLFVEGGTEWNKVSGLNKQGVTNATINSVDLGGLYVGAGLLLTGDIGLFDKVK